MIRTRSILVGLVLAGFGSSVMLLAQTQGQPDPPEPTAPTWRVGRCSVDGRTGKTVERRPRSVDVLRRHRQLNEFACAVQSHVVLADSKGIRVIGPQTSEPSWQLASGPVFGLCADDVLAVAASVEDAGATLSGYAVKNGARAFSIPIRVLPSVLELASHGVAAADDKGLTVFARSGPKLFHVELDVIAIAAGRDWYVRTPKEMVAIDRAGKELWRQPSAFADPRGYGSFVDGDRLFEVHHCVMSDSGFQVRCRDSSTGDVLWQCSEPGLEIPHSKYRHRVVSELRGGRLFLLSDGSGGAFVVELDAETGRRLARAKVEK